MKEIVKAAIGSFNSDSDAKFSLDVGTVLEKMKGNQNFLSPTPTLPTVATSKGLFDQACQAAAGGGTALTAARNLCRAELVGLMRGLAYYVTTTADGDMAKLLTSGFTPQKPSRTPASALSAPVTPVLTLGTNSGELDAATTPVPGAYVYNWRIALDSAPTSDVATGQTTASYYAFTGLTAGVTYLVQVNVTGTVNTSDWSDSASQMVV